MTQTLGKEYEFVGHLQRLNTRLNRGALAALRRGLGKRLGEEGDSLRIFYRYLPQGVERQAEDSYYLIASIFALYPDTPSYPENTPAYQRNLGASFAGLEKNQGQGNSDPNATSSTERRFVALLNSNSEDLHTHLRHAISPLKAKDIPVDWAVLLRDLLWWDSDSRRVQRQWARAFWGRIPSTEASQDSDAESAADGDLVDPTEADE